MSTYNDYIEYLKHVDNTTKEEIDKQIDSLNKEINALKASLTNLQKDKDVLSSQFAKSQKDLAAKDDMLNMKSVEADKLVRKLKELENNLLLLQQQKDSLTISLDKVKKELQQKSKESEDKGFQITEQKIQLDKKINDLQVQYNGLLQKHSLSEKSVSETQESITRFQEKLRQAQELTEQQKERITHLSEQNTQLKEKLKSDENVEAVKKLEAALSKSHEDMELAKVNIQKLRDLISSQDNSIKDYKQKIKYFEDQETILKTDINKQNSKHQKKFIMGLISGASILGLIWMLVALSTPSEIPAEYTDATTDSIMVYDYVEDAETSSGFTYTGQTKESVPCGIGSASFEDNGEFDGAFKDGKLYYGKRTLSSGKTYIGPYVDDKANGVGTYEFSDGSRYIGEFKDDEMNGYGIYIDADGKKSMGEFRNNEFIK